MTNKNILIHCTTSITSTTTVHINSDHLWCPPPPTVPLPSPQPTLSTSTPIISGVPHCITSITSTNTVHNNSDHLWCPPPHCITSITSTNTAHINSDHLWCPPLYHFHYLNQHCPHQLRSSLVSPTVPLPSPQPTLSTSPSIISGAPPPHCTTSITSNNTVHINSDHLWCPPPPTVPLPLPQPTLPTSTPIISDVPHCTTSITSTNTVHINPDHLWCPPLYHFHHLNQHCPHQLRSSLVSPPPTVPLPSPQLTLSTSTPIIFGVPPPPLYHFHHLNQHCPHQLRSSVVFPTVPLPSPQPTLSTSTPIISGVPPPHCTTSITSTNTVHINSDHIWCPPLYHFHHLNQHCPHQLRSSLVFPTVPLPSPQPTLSTSTPTHCTTSITSTNTVHINSDHLWCSPLYHFHHLNQHCPHQLRSSLVSPTVPLPSPQPTLSTSTPIISGVPHCTTSITSTNTVHINSDYLWCPPLYHFHHLNQHCPHQLRPTVPLPSPQPTLSTSTPIISDVPHCTTSRRGSMPGLFSARPSHHRPLGGQPPQIHGHE